MSNDLEQKMQLTPSDSLMYDFFKNFARFEYALKASGFIVDRGYASADWEEFAKSVDGRLERDASTVSAIEYLTKKPPRKQVVGNGELKWKDMTSGTDARSLLLCVRHVRNNLFHGGKTPWDTERDTPLVQHSMSILAACLNASPKVKCVFDLAQ